MLMVIPRGESGSLEMHKDLFFPCLKKSERLIFELFECFTMFIKVILIMTTKEDLFVKHCFKIFQRILSSNYLKIQNNFWWNSEIYTAFL